MTDEIARARVTQLLHWAGDELDMLSTSFRGCTDEQLAALQLAQGVRQLPAAYDEFMRRMGIGGVGSAMAELFPGDDVSLDSMLPSDEWVGSRLLAEQVIAEQNYDLSFGQDTLVIRMHRASEVDYIGVDQPDPPVWGFTGSGVAPEQLFPAFTGWLEFRIGRAIKRRYPLRSAHCPL